MINKAAPNVRQNADDADDAGKRGFNLSAKTRVVCVIRVLLQQPRQSVQFASSMLSIIYLLKYSRYSPAFKVIVSVDELRVISEPEK